MKTGGTDISGDEMNMEFLGLDDLLANVAGHLMRSYDLDGYAIALWDTTDDMLVNQSAQLPARLQTIEPALRQFRFQPNAATVAGLCFSENRTVVIDAQSVENYSDTIRDLYRRWQFSTFAAWPLRLEHGGLIGVFSAFLDQGTIAPGAIAAIEQKLLAATPAIAAALEQEQVEAIDTSLVERHELLRALTTGNLGDTVSAAATPLCEYLLRGSAFDMAAVLLREGEQLILRHDRFSPGYAHFQENWRKLGELRFSLDVGEGLTAVVHEQNTHFMVEDVQNISLAPFSAKDRDVLHALQSVRSFLLLPIRIAGKPVGVLWLISLGQPASVDKSALDTMQLLADFMGTILRRLPPA